MIYLDVYFTLVGTPCKQDQSFQLLDYIFKDQFKHTPMINKKQIFILSQVLSTYLPVFYIIQDTKRTVLIIFLRSSIQPIHYFPP